MKSCRHCHKNPVPYKRALYCPECWKSQIPKEEKERLRSTYNRS